MGKRSDWPRCSEPDCGTAVREIVGDYRGPRQPEVDGKCARHRVEDTEFVPTDVVVPTLEDQEPEIVLDESPVASERIASLRAQLREDVLTSEVSTLLRDSLLEALRAQRQTWTMCQHCKHKTPLSLPDLGTRVTAVVKLLEEVDGRLQAQQEDVRSELQREADQLLKHRAGLTDDELSRLIVSLEKDLSDA